MVLVLLAFVTGLVAYFASWPHGREIGILAVPFGLSVWAMRSGTVGGLLQQIPTVSQRQVLFSSLKWEPVFWLAMVAAGFAGVVLGQRIYSKAGHGRPLKSHVTKQNWHLNAAIGVVGSVFIAQLCLRVFAQDISMADSTLGSVMSQPAMGQLVFAVLLSFGIAAFAVKSILDVDYVWPILATGLVNAFVNISYLKQGTLEHLSAELPAVFLPNAAVSILPVQMVALGAIGSVAGYWMGVRYHYWRQHEAV